MTSRDVLRAHPCYTLLYYEYEIRNIWRDPPTFL